MPRRRVAVVGLVVLALVVVGTVVVRRMREGDSPERAVRALASAAGDKDWGAVRRGLCAADVARLSEQTIAETGRTALLVVRGIHGVEDLRVAPAPPVRDVLGDVEARLVSGTLVPVLGKRSAFSVTVVHEPVGWRVCTADGGYAVAALGLDVPRGS